MIPLRSKPEGEQVMKTALQTQGGQQVDIYQRVTDRIIELLEQGVKPWEPSHFVKTGFPRNFLTGQPYQGINVFLLGMQRYASPWWLTFRQAQEMGGSVRKGEKGSLIVKYGEYDKKDDERQEGEEPQRRGYLKGYWVFNACQIDGIDFPPPPQPQPTNESEQCALARRIVDGMPTPPAMFEGRFARAFYHPATDSVDMPARGFFNSEPSFYKTLFHELVHATGHESRLARKSLQENEGVGAQGESMRTYSQEELVAEMGAAFLAAHAEILESNQMEDSAAYLRGWLSVLRDEDNRKWLVWAASQAQKAADYIMRR